MEKVWNADCSRKPMGLADFPCERRDTEMVTTISLNNEGLNETHGLKKNRMDDNAEKVPSEDNSTDCQWEDDRKSMERLNPKIQEEEILQTATTSTSDVPESQVKEHYSKKFPTDLCSFDSPLYKTIAMLMVGMHTPKSRKRRPVPEIILTSPEGTETKIELPSTPPAVEENVQRSAFISRLRKSTVQQRARFQPGAFLQSKYKKGSVIQRGMYQGSSGNQGLRSRQSTVTRGAKSQQDATKQSYKYEQDSVPKGTNSKQVTIDLNCKKKRDSVFKGAKSQQEAMNLGYNKQYSVLKGAKSQQNTTKQSYQYQQESVVKGVKSQKTPWGRQISKDSSEKSTSSEDFEYKSCGGFKLPSPEKTFHPPRNPFAIPETFEPASASRQIGCQSFGPQPFPSLIFDHAPEKDTNKPKTENLYRCSPTTNIKAVVGDVPVVAFDADSSQPQNDTHLPKSLFNPKNLHFPYYTCGNEQMPMEHGIPRNPDRLVTNASYRLSDPLQNLCSQTMKEFEKVYGQYIVSLESRVSRKLTSMQQFMSQVRNATSVVTDSGAIVTNMEIPFDVRSGIMRINELTEGLAFARWNLNILFKYCYWVYLNLKYRPFDTYRSGNGASRMDEIHTLETYTKLVVNWLIQAMRLIDSYPVLKTYVENYVFRERQLNEAKAVLKHN